MTARTIMVQGTASSVGKSIVATALCRYFRNLGLRVAPFKSQNMALNAYVTPDGGEIGRAQAVQAQAARVVPTVDMNPILLKPEGDARSQVVVLGRPIGSLGAVDYHTRKPELRDVVRQSLARLRAAHDIVVIEGAGSPAEINLKDRDLVNMFVAGIADAPVLLVGDIDRGGVFAAFVGTMELLDKDERARVAGFVINKFRGDVRLLDSGLTFLENKTGVPVLGVLPYVRQLRVADEDSVSLDHRPRREPARDGELEIAVVRLPRISNHDDFQPLDHEPGVIVRFVDRAADVAGADLVVLPGSKTTCADLAWLRETGIAEAIVARAARGGRVLGICGGCQMLGVSIDDSEAIESDGGTVAGLGLLPLRVRFGRDKRTSQVKARSNGSHWMAGHGELTGYEIHMGRAALTDGGDASFRLRERNGESCSDSDGAVSADGVVVGTMLHGLFENTSVRAALIASLRARRGWSPTPPRSLPAEVDEYDRLADVIRAHIRTDRLHALVGL